MERIKSVICGRDNEVLTNLFEFYTHPTGRIVDLTCNKRRMWKGLNTKDVTFCDIDPLMNPDIVCDFRETPFKDGECSVLVFDPPHLPSAAGSPKSLETFVANYGLRKTEDGDNVDAFYAPFLLEAKRILKDDGLVFAKLADYVHNHKYQWSLVSFVNAVRQTEGLTATDLIIKCDPSAGNLTSSKWEKAHHARRAHCWWVVVRKGRCEPKKDYRAEGNRLANPT